jgi:uracil-DNA glycosylase
MPNPRKLLRQWLETDAALGVTEVPLPRRRKSFAAKTAAASPGTAVPGRVAAPAQPFAARPVSPARPPVQVGPARHSDTPPPRYAATSPAPAFAARVRTSVTLPPIPPGDIPALAPLTGAQKEQLFAQWLADLNAASGPFLSDLATKVVPGEGALDAPLLFVGEGPGAEEDRLGRPFVGRSGQLLDKMIKAMGFQREQIYIANIVKLRCAEWDELSGRPKDRPPTADEAARGLPFLHRQIEIIRPRVIVTLGAPAIKFLTGETEGVMKIRGHWRDFRGIPVMPTYHPAFVLRAYTEENRRKVWSDLQQVMKLLARP